MKQTINKIASFTLAFALVFGVTIMAEAAPVTTLSNNMSRQKIGVASTHNLNFTIPDAIAAGGSILLTFPNFDFTGVGTGDVTATGGPTVALGGTNNTEVTLTYSAGQAAGAINVTIGGTAALNPATPGNQIITIDVDTDAVAGSEDTGRITVPIINDDQIVVKARVNQVLFFDVRDTTGGVDDDNMVDFGALSSAASTFATDGPGGTASAAPSSEFEAGTNATGGYTISVTGTTLTSGVDTIDAISTPAAPAPGTEQFGLAVAAGTGSGHGTIGGNYSGGNYFLDTAAQDVIVTRSNPAQDSTYDVTYVANITSATEAGDYEAVLTYTMVANF